MKGIHSIVQFTISCLNVYPTVLLHGPHAYTCFNWCMHSGIGTCICEHQYQSINQPVNQSINQSVNQSIDRLINQSINTGLHNLTYLDLDGNSIREIQSGAFSDLANLQTLNLSENHLSVLYMDSFKGKA